jgi:predicted nuclease of restriction endonuclease-like (RecB) superfamily
MSNQEMNFNTLVAVIREVNQQLSAQAKRAVNVSLTMRNWLIGCHIAEYLLHGKDRAKYGDKTIPELARQLQDLSNCNRRQLYDFLRFYRTWPEIVPTLSAQSEFAEISTSEIVPAAWAQLSLQPQSIVFKLSYNMFKLLMEVENPVARSFYENECMRGNWSVRELKRQIASLYFERMGLSTEKRQLSQQTRQKAELDQLALTIRDPYIFEFLELKPQEVMSESALEDQLIDKLEDFLLEMGRGFCFEARQKRLLIGDEFFFVDLVFYHRILKCHVLIELKAEPFTHENIGQLNTYVNYYRKNEMYDGDNPPVGILLCTGKNNALLEYALAGLDKRLFVSKYLLELPSKEMMESFINQQLEELGASPKRGDK